MSEQNEKIQDGLLQKILADIDLEDDNAVENILKDDIEQNTQLEEDEANELLKLISEEREILTEAEKKDNQAWILEYDIKERKSSVIFHEDFVEKLRNGKKIAKEKRDERRERIAKFAIQQQDICLSDIMTLEQKQMLLQKLDEINSKACNSIFAAICTNVSKLLRNFIPNDLKYCYYKYPASVKRHPGFIYECSEQYGDSLSLWVTPNLPVYLAANSEMSLLRSLPQEALISIDKQIKYYYKRKSGVLSKRIHNAAYVAKLKKITFLHILKKDPIWFEYIYELITNKKMFE